MTQQEREEMFSKDYLTNHDLALLLGLDISTASTWLSNIKRKTDRLGIRGKIHIQDYLDYFGITDATRYGGKPNEHSMA